MNEANAMKNLKTKDKKTPLVALLSGLGIGYAITCIIFIAYAILLTYTNITEKNIPIVVLATVVLSVLVAGYDAAKAVEKKGWLWGMLAGLLYAVIMILIGLSVLRNFGLDGKMFTLLVLSLAGGGLGGIIGINFKK